jgi:uncharacterized protein
MVSPKPWQFEPALRLAARLLLCFSVAAMLSMAVRHWLGDRLVEDLLLNVVLATLGFQVAGLVLVAYFLREHQIGWVEAFGFKTEPGWAVTLGIATAIIALPVAWSLQSVGIELLTRWGIPVADQEAVQLLSGAHALWKQVYLGVLTVLIAPLAEEILFRGILYTFLKQHTHRQLALWGTAVLFAGIHLNFGVLLPLFFLALVLAMLYEWTDNLLACIVVHSLFNGANFAMLFILNSPPHVPGK